MWPCGQTGADGTRDRFTFGDFMYLVAINIWVLDKTASAAAVAGLWVVSRFAAPSLGPWAGSVSDPLPRRTQLIAIEDCTSQGGFEMFLVLLKYVKALSEVDTHLDEHVEFLDKHYAARKFIFSGRRNPRVGGVILVNSDSEAEVRGIIQDDPFHRHQVAEYEVIEFTPTKYDERFRGFVE